MAEAGLLLLAFLLPLFVVLVGLPPFNRYLSRRGRVADDVHKVPPTKVPLPAGPVLFLAAIAGEASVFLLTGSLVPLAVSAGTTVAFLIGLADDLYVLGGRTKPVLLLLASVAFVGFDFLQPDLYQPSIAFPLLGSTSPHLIIYTALAIVSFPVLANAFNMMDSFNGQISWFTLLTSLALAFGLTLRAFYSHGSWDRVAMALPLVAVAAGFLVFNRYPSRSFDGDSGSLMFGALFAALAIAGGVEIAAMIAVLPAILNSFYTLSSVRGFVERRKMSARPTYVGDDGKLNATLDPGAPNTLVRLILLGGPLSERELVGNIILITAFACLLSAAISLLTWVN